MQLACLAAQDARVTQGVGTVWERSLCILAEHHPLPLAPVDSFCLFSSLYGFPMSFTFAVYEEVISSECYKNEASKYRIEASIIMRCGS